MTQSPRRHHRDTLSPTSTPASQMSYTQTHRSQNTGSSEGQRYLNRGDGGTHPRGSNRGFHQGSSRCFNQGGYTSDANKWRKDEDVITGEGCQFNVRAANPYQHKTSVSECLYPESVQIIEEQMLLNMSLAPHHA